MKSLLNLTPQRLKLLIVALPVLLMAIYLTLFAADRYVSESTVAVRSASNDISALPGAALMLAGVSPPARQDTQYLIHYIHSLGLLQRLEAELNLRAHYASPKLDLPFRLAAGSSQEDFLAYYRQRVHVSLDDASSLLTVQVQAFDPQFAQRLNKRILEESEKFVNESSRHIAREQLRFAEGEAKTASERVRAAKDQLLTFQSKNRLIDPAGQVQASSFITAELQGSLARRQAELKGLQAYLNDSAPQVQQMRSEVNALQAQIDVERSRATSADRDGQRLNALAADFLGLKLSVDFSLDGYRLALAAVENARIETTRKLKSIVTIEPSSLPETAEFPLFFYNLATTFVACLLLYAIARLVLATIREHQD